MVMVAPIIPGLNESEAAEIMQAASEAGATGAGFVMLRLPHQIKDLFLDWLRRHYPDRAAKVENLIRQMRGGELYQGDFFVRQRGSGPRAEQFAQLFEVFKRRHGLAERYSKLSSDEFQRRRKDRQSRGQLGLFG